MVEGGHIVHHNVPVRKFYLQRQCSEIDKLFWALARPCYFSSLLEILSFDETNRDREIIEVSSVVYVFKIMLDTGVTWVNIFLLGTRRQLTIRLKG